jgi:phosphoglycerate dehydrogenase-like enzyme
MYRIWVDEQPLDSVLPMLSGVAEVVGPGADLSELSRCDGALDPGARWDALRMDRCDRLRVISRIGVGYDNIDVGAATLRGIQVCYTPHGPTVSTAEHATALIFAAAKTVCYADRDVRAGRWHRAFRTVKGMELRGRVLVGAGRIGIEVARVMRAVGMRVLVYDPALTEARAGEEGVERVGSLESLLSAADVVSLHAPATAETRHLINAARLAWMKPGSILVNTARGALVDERALCEALRSGHLAAAGLDVFEREPVESSNPLLDLENVVLTDHIASHTWAGHHRLYEMAVLQLLQVLRGEQPDCPLNSV